MLHKNVLSSLTDRSRATFYIDSTGQHGLIAPTKDIENAAWWNDKYVTTGAKDKAIGSGAINTRKIIRKQGRPGSYAALPCAQYKGGGYTDWYLLSIRELHLLYL